MTTARAASAWRLPLALALVAAFAAGGWAAGELAVDDTRHSVTTDEGREVSVGVRWPGDLDSCVTDDKIDELPNCYREKLAEGSYVKQPWSTISTLAFCIVAFLLLAIADRERLLGVDPDDLATWYGFVALFMGPGSALFHGTLTTWGGWFDQLSMYALLAAIVGVDVARLSDGRRSFVRWFVGALVMSAALKAISGEAGTYVFIAVGVGVGVFALVSWLRLLARAGLQRSGARLLLAYVALFSAIVPWLASNPSAGPPTDTPYHVLWHVVSAVFVGVYWWYVRSEDQVGSSDPASRSSAAENARTAIPVTRS